MNPIQLAGLVKRAYPDFDMNKFGNRLKLQKFIYLVQYSGLNLGYEFILYLHGPYSTMLAREGFDIPNLNECQELKFENQELEQKFLALLNFLKDKKDDEDTMEIIASLLLFHKIYPDKNEEEIIRLVEDKSPKFNGRIEEIKKDLSELKSCEVLPWQ